MGINFSILNPNSSSDVKPVQVLYNIAINHFMQQVLFGTLLLLLNPLHQWCHEAAHHSAMVLYKHKFLPIRICDHERKIHQRYLS
jgi:hypothetical protein